MRVAMEGWHHENGRNGHHKLYHVMVCLFHIEYEQRLVPLCVYYPLWGDDSRVAYPSRTWVRVRSESDPGHSKTSRLTRARCRQR